jgi:hypothetical protein
VGVRPFGSASPRLREAKCNTVEQMRLVNTLRTLPTLMMCVGESRKTLFPNRPSRDPTPGMSPLSQLGLPPISY